MFKPKQAQQSTFQAMTGIQLKKWDSCFHFVVNLLQWKVHIMCTEWPPLSFMPITFTVGDNTVKKYLLKSLILY